MSRERSIFQLAAALDGDGNYYDGEAEARLISGMSPRERRRYERLKAEWEQWRYRRSKLPRAKRGPMMRVGERECKRCATFFEPTTMRQRFCSPRCRKGYHASLQVTSKPVPVIASQERTPCPVCGEPMDRRRRTRLYCSNACRQEAYRARRAAAPTR